MVTQSARPALIAGAVWARGAPWPKPRTRRTEWTAGRSGCQRQRVEHALEHRSHSGARPLGSCDAQAPSHPRPTLAWVVAAPAAERHESEPGVASSRPERVWTYASGDQHMALPDCDGWPEAWRVRSSANSAETRYRSMNRGIPTLVPGALRV